MAGGQRTDFLTQRIALRSEDVHLAVQLLEFGLDGAELFAEFLDLHCPFQQLLHASAEQLGAIAGGVQFFAESGGLLQIDARLVELLLERIDSRPQVGGLLASAAQLLASGDDSVSAFGQIGAQPLGLVLQGRHFQPSDAQSGRRLFVAGVGIFGSRSAEGMIAVLAGDALPQVADAHLERLAALRTLNGQFGVKGVFAILTGDDLVAVLLAHPQTALAIRTGDLRILSHGEFRGRKRHAGRRQCQTHRNTLPARRCH